MYTFPLALSLLSTIPICFIICWVGYIVQDRIDQMTNNKYLQNEIDSLLIKVKEYENIDLYKMTETELRQYGASKMLSEVQQDILVMRVLEHLKISEICKYRNYGRTTIKYHMAEIKRKLNIGQI
jgi:DNA-directed RNA polymerase specialized sigma24 family protein